MKRYLFKKAMLLLFTLMAGNGSVRAEEVVFDFANNYSDITVTENVFLKGDVSITLAQNGGSSTPCYNPGQRCVVLYRLTNGTQGSTMTISCSKTITKAVFTYKINFTAPDDSFSPEGHSLSGTVGTWKGSTNSLVLTNKQEYSNKSIKIEKIVVTIHPVTINLNKACTDGSKYYGTFSNCIPFVVPSDLTVSEITVANGKLQLADYATDDVVPANTGVMVSSATAGNHSVALSVQDGTSKLGTNNMLKASGNSGIDVDGMSTAAPYCLYYRLTMHDGETIGYYWGASNGGAFTLDANKAYLAVPQSLAREGFNFFDNDSQSIDGLIREANNNSSEVYDLQGRKTAVNSKLNKGIYIVNGKKVVK